MRDKQPRPREDRTRGEVRRQVVAFGLFRQDLASMIGQKHRDRSHCTAPLFFYSPSSVVVALNQARNPPTHQNLRSLTDASLDNFVELQLIAKSFSNHV